MHNRQGYRQHTEKGIHLTMILLFIFTSPLFGQKVEIFTGPTHHNYTILKSGSGHFSCNNVSGVGFVAGIALDSVIENKLRWRFTLQFDQYNGYIDVSDGGLGGFEYMAANSKKSNLSLGIYPFSFEIKNKLHINAGALVSYVLHEKLTGQYTKTIMGQSTTINLEDVGQFYKKKLLVGTQLRLAYDVKISPSLILSPQYLFHLGLNGEFKTLLNKATSVRHYFCVGVKYGI